MKDSTVRGKERQRVVRQCSTVRGRKRFNCEEQLWLIRDRSLIFEGE